MSPLLQIEHELLLRAKRRETDALEALLSRYRPLVESRARHFAGPRDERDDLIQEGMLSLFHAIEKFDDRRSVGFAAYADVCVRRRLISLQRRERRQLEFVDSSALHEMATTCTTPEVFGLELDLTDLEQHVLLGFQQGMSYQEIAAQLGCSTKRVDNAIQRIRRKTRASLRN